MDLDWQEYEEKVISNLWSKDGMGNIKVLDKGMGILQGLKRVGSGYGIRILGVWKTDTSRLAKEWGYGCGMGVRYRVWIWDIG